MRISKKWFCGVWSVAFACSLAVNALAAEPEHKPTQFVPARVWSQSISNVVAVVENATLAHTAQLFPLNESGKVVGGARLPAQLSQTLKNLGAALTAVGSSVDDTLKLNLYASTPAVAAQLQTEFDKAWPGKSRPAITLVVSPLPVAGALVALDAVADVRDAKALEELSRDYSMFKVKRDAVQSLASAKRASSVAILPRGDVLYVSGQAIPGDTIHAAAKSTFEGLLRTLKQYELSPDAIVQFKVFLDPVSKADEVEQALTELLPEGLLPPLVFVQWESPGSVEIEMIAAAPAVKDLPAGQTISFLTPPWMSASPNYCRVTRVHGGRRVYFPGIMAGKSGDGAAQIKSVFKSLGDIAELVDTDYEHLAKATYYVSDKDASAQLNKLRPDYYNPRRPPAASKAAVKDVGFPGRSFMMDIIAVVPEKK